MDRTTRNNLLSRRRYEPLTAAPAEGTLHKTVMELLTKQIIRKFEEHPIYSQDGKGLKAEVLVKYFNPMGAGTWLITEAEKQEDGDWKLFGFCHICEWEWGYLMLSDLQRIVLPGGLGIERDLYTQGRIVEDFME